MCGNDSRSQKQGDPSPLGAGLGSRGLVLALARTSNGTDGTTA